MPEKEAELTALETTESAIPVDSAEDAETVGVDASADAEAAAGSGTEFDQLKSENEKLKAERDQLVDRLARLQAEFENARKRAERERAEFRDYATGMVVEQFLPVVDNFELALKAAGTTEQLRSGVELIVKQMEDIL